MKTSSLEIKILFYKKNKRNKNSEKKYFKEIIKKIKN